MYQRKKRERGVILLVVLSLLTIFTLMGATFVIVSGSYRSAAEVSARLGAREPDPRQLTDDAAYALFTDTVDARSSLRSHGLLRDMYGDDGFTANVASVSQLLPSPSNTNVQVGQFFGVTLGNLQDYDGVALSDGLSPIAGYYGGCVLTFVDGPARGHSTRVVDYDPITGTFLVMPIEGRSTVFPLNGNRVVVNGRPFSGSGFGFNRSSLANDGPDPGPDGEWGVAGVDDDGNGVVDDYFEAGFSNSDDVLGVALQPNRLPSTVAVGANTVMNPSRTALNAYLAGGADESYDAADYQNMHLAAIVPNPANPSRSFVLPSLHRPALINWWLWNVILPEMTSDMGSVPTPTQLISAFLRPYGPDNVRAALGGGDDPAFISLAMRDRIVALKQRIILRPLPEANPNFTGTNAEFTSFNFGLVTEPNRSPYLSGPWDIDNDGDGDTDSIWIDAGMPILENAEGRLYKPLVAILCTDLDGRLNLNAQGGQGHLIAANPSPTDFAALPQELAGELDTGINAAGLVPGMGTGPADVNLGVLFARPADPLGLGLYSRLLRGDPTGRINGRYGRDDQPGSLGPDVLALAKIFQHPANFYNVNVHGGFESPPDLNGELTLALDHRGQPRFSVPNTNRNLTVNHAYEKDLLTRKASDQLFEISELEALLRYNDTDVNPPDGLPAARRLMKLLEATPGQGFFTAPAPRPTDTAARPFGPTPLHRRLVTTHSADLPVPNMSEPPDLAGFAPTNQAQFAVLQRLKPNSQNNNFRFHHVAEILRARLMQNLDGAGGWMQPVIADPVNSWNQTASPHDHRLNLAMSGIQAMNSVPAMSMLSHDLRMGLRFDVNRPFGNGRDDNGNGVVDEHGFGGPDAAGRFRNLEASLWELTAPERLWQNGPWGPAGVGFDHDNDNVISDDQDAFLARAHYARHLYILMMMLKDPAYFTEIDVDRDGNVGSADPTDTARLFAQWAVNAVDFRDPDSIMTPFEFDLTPFTAHVGNDGGWGIAGTDDDGINGTDDPGEAMWPGSDDLPPWGVDGVIGIGPGPDRIFGNGDDFDDATLNPDRAVVWGIERPELLITETLAWHDRRTEDLSNDDGIQQDTQNGDPNFDQRLRPQGSFYVELYNPWTSPSLRKPAEFYDGNTPDVSGVQLDRLTPVDPITPSAPRSPVWRLLVVSGTAGHEGTADYDAPYDSTRAKPNDSDRVVYFGRNGGHPAGTAQVFPDPATSPADPLISNPARASRFARLIGGRYAVVGTVRGQSTDLPDPADGNTPNGIPDWVNTVGRRSDVSESNLMPEATRRIVLQPHQIPDKNRVFVEGNDAAVALPRVLDSTASRPPVVDALPPVAIPIRNLNVSEEIGVAYPAADTVTASGEPAYTVPFDEPLDIAEYLTQDSMNVFGRSVNDDVWDKVVHLQRLANPLQPWNPYPGEANYNPELAVNPYMTVDTMAVDLASFNGVSNDADPVATGSTIVGFYSRQRGEGEPPGARALWRQTRLMMGRGRRPTGRGALAGPHFFDVNLHHSLGFLNDLPNGQFIYGPRFQHDSSGSTSTAPALAYIGAPNTRAGVGVPFPWFNWLNRPFTSHYEMLQIPRSSSYGLLREWAPVDPARSKSAYDEKEPAEFNHLLNFFESTDPDVVPKTPAADLARLFDFVHVPSPFVGTETLLNPVVFGNANIAPGTQNFRPPFNRVSKYREPGKINLNTAYAPVVIDAIRGAAPPSGVGPWFNAIADSRRAFGERLPDTVNPSPPERRNDAATSWIRTGTQIPTFDPSDPGYDPVVNTVPTVFANPFRGFGDAPLVPLPRLVRPFIESTLLRSNRIDYRDPYLTSSGAADWPVAPAAPAGDAPLFVRPQLLSGPHNDPNRNTYFRYEPMQRFANLVTTRSNVYAVWVTVGFFEVENVLPSPLNPFGYRIGAEIGWDTGDVKRHRAFYVIDRSIPVAFEPGKRHNIDKAILLKRFIE